MSNIPDDLKYSKDHEWVRVEEDNIAYVGITDHAQGALGELVYVEVETVGETLAAGDEFGTVEAVKTTSELFMPVSGEILEFNPEIDDSEGDNPTKINDEPYGGGWIIKVRMSDPEELKDLMDAKGYAEEIK